MRCARLTVVALAACLLRTIGVPAAAAAAAPTGSPVGAPPPPPPAAPATATTAAARPTLANPAPTPGYQVHQGVGGETDVNACSSDVAPGQARCFVRTRTDPAARARAAAAGVGPAANPPGYAPADLQSAYNAPSATAGGGQTVAIVDAYDNPTAESDLAAYRSTYGLPACTSANSCFRKIDQNGGTHFPVTDSRWRTEISLDLDMVSALCPLCHILLVEANNASLSDLGTAVNTAAALGANAISNSYGGGEYLGETNDSSAYFNHPGVAVVASTGDDGYGPQFPAASPTVTAVGGTRLTRVAGGGSRAWSETAWSGAGSGCSGYVPKPATQHDSGCATRTLADVSAVSDPATGVAVYDQGRWLIAGGTSAASPIVGAMYALAGNPPSSTTMAALPYSAAPTELNDVISGTNGACSPDYLCSAGPGYDGPTGLGTPQGTGAFSAKRASAVGLAGSPNPVQVSHPVTLTATVNAATGSGVPTGTVTFLDGGASLGTAPVGAGGSAGLVTSALTTGSHSLTAGYGGDAGFAAGTSAPLTESVYSGTAAAPVWTNDTPPASATVGTPWSYTFTASGNPPPVFTVASGALPSGLHLTGTTGVLAGTPDGVGPATFTIAATGFAPAAASASITITVNPAALAFEDLGGTMAAGSAPATASWGTGRLDVVIRGSDNTVYHKWFAGSWSAFEPLAGATADNPAAVSWAPGRLDVFVRGTDNQLWHRWYAGGWSAWEPLGGALSSAPTVTSWGPGRLDVFVRGTDNHLWHRWYAGGWSGWEPLGGGLTSAPSATAWAPGRIDLVARGDDGAVWHLWYSGGWSGWESLSGAVTGAPQISSWGPGRLDVYAVHQADGWLDHRWYSGGWSAWTELGGAPSGPPSAVSWAPGRTDLFLNGQTGRTGRSGDLMHWWTTG